MNYNIKYIQYILSSLKCNIFLKINLKFKEKIIHIYHNILHICLQFFVSILNHIICNDNVKSFTIYCHRKFSIHNLDNKILYLQLFYHKHRMNVWILHIMLFVLHYIPMLCDHDKILSIHYPM